MSLVGYAARNHPQQVNQRGRLAAVDDRSITPADFTPLHERFAFTVDAAASADNAMLPRFWTEENSGLLACWAGERVWCNPPYSHPNLELWTAKAWAEFPRCELVVMLVPANRTEQRWWQANIEPHRDRGRGLRTEFLRGRMRFAAPGAPGVGPNERPPFGCCLLIWEAPRPVPAQWHAAGAVAGRDQPTAHGQATPGRAPAPGR